SAITGYLLSISDDYDRTLVSWHQWMGISTAILSGILYQMEKKSRNAATKKTMGIVLLLMIIVTGHLGGSLTHGSDYLTRPLTNTGKENIAGAIKPLPDVQEALAYSDVVKPIL